MEFRLGLTNNINPTNSNFDSNDQYNLLSNDSNSNFDSNDQYNLLSNDSKEKKLFARDDRFLTDVQQSAMTIDKSPHVMVLKNQKSFKTDVQPYSFDRFSSVKPSSGSFNSFFLHNPFSLPLDKICDSSPLEDRYPSNNNNYLQETHFQNDCFKEANFHPVNAQSVMRSQLENWAKQGLSEEIEKVIFSPRSDNESHQQKSYEAETYDYNLLLKAYNNDRVLYDGKKLERVEECIKKMKGKQIKLDSDTYQNAIKASFKNNNLQKVENWVEAARKNNKLNTAGIFTEMIEGYLKSGHIIPAEKAFGELIKMAETTTVIKKEALCSIFNHFLCSFSEHDHSDKFNEYLEKMKAMQVEKDHMTYSIMIDHALGSKKGQYIQDSPILEGSTISDERWKKANEIFEEYKPQKNDENDEIEKTAKSLNCQNMTMNVLQVQILNWFIKNSEDKEITLKYNPKIYEPKQRLKAFVELYVPGLKIILQTNLSKLILTRNQAN